MARERTNLPQNSGILVEAPFVEVRPSRTKLSDMNPKHLKELLHAAPSVPFTIVLANGKTFQVGNPDVLNVTAQGQIIHQDVTGPTSFINPILITDMIKLTHANEA